MKVHTTTDAAEAPARTVGVQHTLDFVEEVLRPCSVVEIGSGRGHLASRLVARGFRVLGVDVDQEALAAARQRGVTVRCSDVLHLEPSALGPEPVEAVLFSRSLHHVADPRQALERARALLAAGGWILIEDFAHDCADRPAAAWRYDLEAFLCQRFDGRDAAIKVFPADPLGAWREDHPADHLNGLSRLQAAVDAQLPGAQHATAPYLYRYLLDLLPQGEEGGRQGRALLAWEEACLQRGLLPAVGHRWWWRNASGQS